MLVKKITGFT